MKLYTEEQIKDAFIRGVLKGMAGSTLSTYELFEMYISELTPIELPSNPGKDTADYIDRHIVQAMVEVAKEIIELPSDEEIKSYSDRYSTIHEDVSDKLGKYLVSAIHIDGAKWMKEQILNQNK